MLQSILELLGVGWAPPISVENPRPAGTLAVASIGMKTFTSIVVSALFATSLEAQTFSTYGAGCLGSNGVPTLHAAGLPALGHTLQLQLNNAPAGAPSSLWLGTSKLVPPVDLGFLGSQGCQLLILPDIVNLDGPTSSDGTRAIDLAVPNALGLIGTVLETQWIVLDLAIPRVTTSNGGTAVIDALPPPVTGGTLVGPTSGAVGTVIQVRVTDLGTSDPDDICLRSGGPGLGGLSLFRALSIVPDVSTGEDVITAELVTARPSPVGMGGFMLTRGAGSQPAVSTSGCLSMPASTWNWEGFDLPGGTLIFPGSFSPTPTGTQVTLPFVHDSGTNSLVADVPNYPWDTSGIYPPGSSVTTDAHGDTTCGGGAPGGHFDHFLGTATVDAGCVAGISKQTLAIDHAPQVQEAFDNTFGPGRLTVTAETGAGFARIRIAPANPTCTLTGGGGSIVLVQ